MPEEREEREGRGKQGPDCSPLSKADVDLLLQALFATELAPSQLRTAGKERLKVANLVFSTWTEGGKQPAGLASKYFDGALSLLEEYVTGASPQGGRRKKAPALTQQADLSRMEEPPASPPGEGDVGSEGESPSKSSSTSSSGEEAAIPRVKSSKLSYSEFVMRYMRPNMPVIIEDLGLGWRSFREWVLPGKGEVDIAYLEEHYGSASAPVHSQDPPGGGNPSQGSSGVAEMTVADYCRWWREHCLKRDCFERDGERAKEEAGSEQALEGEEEKDIEEETERVPEREGDQQLERMPQGKYELEDSRAAQEGGPQPGKLLYLKDWHFTATFPEYKAYETPVFFMEDWLNSFMSAKQRSLQRATLKGPHVSQTSVSTAHQGVLPAAGESERGGERGGGEGGRNGAGYETGRGDSRTERGPCRAGSAEGSVRRLEEGQDAVSTAEAEGAKGEAGERRKEGSATGGDYRFVYLGPKGTATPVHSDVLRSYSWSINVAGRKRWHMLAPQYVHLLYDRFGRDTAKSFLLSPGEAEAYPNLADARRHLITCEQGTGEAIFVPSGYFHSVENLEDTLSINHNWLNAHNLPWAWHLLQEDRGGCAEHIKDCRESSSEAEFEVLVEQLLDSNTGFSTRGFGNFVAFGLFTLLRRHVCAACSPRLQTLCLGQLEAFDTGGAVKSGRGHEEGGEGLGTTQQRVYELDMTGLLLAADSAHSAALVLREVRAEIERQRRVQLGSSAKEDSVQGEASFSYPRLAEDLDSTQIEDRVWEYLSGASDCQYLAFAEHLLLEAERFVAAVRTEVLMRRSG